ncbi:MAG TPA: 3,4-dihydroxy-2-butanone-4-phosphate synthase [Turneriella sp.]|nr:3,4-dihydroxy-2-butanone-4-phosphate synthase [Turneriella sp.]
MLKKLSQIPLLRKSVSGIVDVPTALAAFKAGKMLIVTDSEDRENEGDLVISADDSTPETVNFMAKFGRGLICVPVTRNRAEKLNFQPMVEHNEDARRTAFTVSVDAKEKTSTGISAHDRYYTIKKIADGASRANDFMRPGHIFPLVAVEGGVLVRAGHTEASVDLCRLTGKSPVGVICEIMKDDGTMARMADLKKFSKDHHLPILTIEALIEYRRKSEQTVAFSHKDKLKTKWGDFTAHYFNSAIDANVHVALSRGKIDGKEPVLVRVHREDVLADVFQITPRKNYMAVDEAMAALAKAKRGVFLFLGQKSSQLIPESDRTLREYGIGAQILTHLGVKKIKLLTRNPRRVVGLDAFGLEIVETVTE